MSIQPQPDRVIIFDTTLRDGEQSPGATLNVEEKLAIAHQLALLGVDVIEAGFAVSSPGDFAAVRTIAQQVGVPGGPVICSLARAIRKDIQAAAEALKPAAHPRIHVFISTSDIHLKHQLRKSRSEVLAIAEEMVAYAKSFVEDVEFSPMDATRSDREFLYQVLERAIAAGATTLNIPDTVGYSTPKDMGALIQGIRANVPNSDRVIMSVHAQNDLGLATANALAAIENGVRQVECTINGIGERAGNTALEEIVMALQVRKADFNPYFGRPVESDAPLTRINTQEIYKTSRLVSQSTGILVQPNKAIVGANAFAHESGIHQDGVLKHRETYEIMDAAAIGLSENQIVLGKHSGRNAFRTRLQELGFNLSEDELNKAFHRFKEVADKKKEVSDWDLEAIVRDETLPQVEQGFQLEHVQVICGDCACPTATVTVMNPSGEIRTDAAVGTGPVDAVYQAINRLVQIPNQLIEFSVQSVTQGIDALGTVTIRLRHQERIFSGQASDTDIVVASAYAYVNALNRLYRYIQTQTDELKVSPISQQYSERPEFFVNSQLQAD
ncbi:2-isopropylmalate synthase [Allocoleopsis franciscana]|uniref:2-isopropylmalate synthase n=1 Tax=Allocoleopsis franciscana PCC 7113 TaxID=1173027 RepID=K9WQ42_9CYAN|nr:2-isopropylmalate synthase [Allocoleopsis franciscana]AFZ21657.1 2-isopropylmalate synthase [Allocoleopsis franciscana PCC 7113]